MCNHYWGYGGGPVWQNPITGEYEIVNYRYCWTCGRVEKKLWEDSDWEYAPEWVNKFKHIMWACKF